MKSALKWKKVLPFRLLGENKQEVTEIVSPVETEEKIYEVNQETLKF